MNATHEETTQKDEFLSTRSEQAQARKYLEDPRMFPSGIKNADFLRITNARVLFRNFDMLFMRYCEKVKISENSRAAGLRIKTNTVVERWPLRLKENATKEEFETLLASGHTGCERYVEWVSLT